MSDLDEMLKAADPARLTQTPALRDAAGQVAREVRVEYPRQRRNRWRVRATALGVGALVLAPTGYVVAESLGSHTEINAQPNEHTEDESEVINTCGTDFASVIMEYAPTDRPLPRSVTYRMIADSLRLRMQETCTSTEADVAKGEPQTAQNLRLNFEFSADEAWKVAWLRAVQRHDPAAAQAAIAQVDATSERPLVKVVQKEHHATGGYNDRTVAAMRAGKVAEVITPGPADPAWYKAIR